MLFERTMKNMVYGYIIKQKNDQYLLEYKKWNDGIFNDMIFPSSWEAYDYHGTVLHIYDDIETAKRDGNIFLVEMSCCEILGLHERIVVKYWNEKESNIEKQPINNLYIYDDDFHEIWSMDVFLQREEVCTGVIQISEDVVQFSTFSGISYEIELEGLQCMNTRFVK